MERKKELITKIQKKLGLKSYKEAKNVFDTVNEVYEEALREKGSVKIYNIGIIKKGLKKERNIKVPKIKGIVHVPTRLGLFFKADKKFEESLN